MTRDGDRRRRDDRDAGEAEAGRKRLFIAVPLDADAREAITRLAAEVRSSVEDGDTLRWVRLESVHLTLRFLGATAETEIPALRSLLDDAAIDVPQFEVAIAGAGAFPTPSRPRVLWLGVRQGATEMAAMARALEEPLAAAGWSPEDRPFRVHLTLARADGVRAGAAVAARLAQAASAFEVRFRADRVVLFESRTERGGARYTALHESPLAAG